VYFRQAGKPDRSTFIMTTPAQRRTPGSLPERHRTLAEVCDLYFPGVTAVALRWMIKRRGYAHSRWGREYRLTRSQVAAIQEDLARPSREAQPTSRSPRGAPASKQPEKTGAPTQADGPSARRRRQALSRADARLALAEQLASPLAVTAAPDSRAARHREA
jgi:hypothetical protein